MYSSQRPIPERARGVAQAVWARAMVQAARVKPLLQRLARILREAAQKVWQQSLRIWFRISARLYAAIGVAVALTFVASLTAWLAFDRIADSQSEVNENSIPQLAASFAVAQQGSALVVAASRLAVVASEDELEEVVAGINSQRQAFETQLLELTSQSGERFGTVRSQGGALIANIDAIERAAAEQFELAGQERQWRGLLMDLQQDVEQLPGSVPMALRDDALAAVNLLTSAMVVTDAASLESLRERFSELVTSIRVSASAPGVGSGARDAVGSVADRLFNLENSQQAAFGLRARQIGMMQREQDLLAANRVLSGELIAEINSLVEVVEESVASAALSSEDAIATSRNLLITINGISVVGAVLVAWLVVGRLLLRRLGRLSASMQSMADGDLEAEVDIRGRDEVADMAAALEVFRRHALEVQRLNLVEKLAEQLREKNGQLESALSDLKRAQNQIIAREKLAGLGELTAGVAHEIRNPLNFVKNFSEVSDDLVAELKEELESGENSFSKKQKAVIEPITENLADNINRICAHGARAERIVSHMVNLGASTGKRQPTNINRLLEDQAGIAVHGFEATNPDIKFNVEKSLDPTIGVVELVPQDMGRVFQNLVHNACYAVNERYLAEKKARKKRREPTISLTTRLVDDKVEVRIRDNGTGIPKDQVEKIFHPFFTTKPTDQGAGLGLSICNDILRGHGGTVQVETGLGSHTEMILEIPGTAAGGAGERASAEDASPQAGAAPAAP